MKLGIVGHGRHGKDTVAEFFAEASGMRYKAGTSYYARHLVFERMKQSGVFYATPDVCWIDRHNHRESWARYICEYNASDPVQLYRDCLADQDLLTGIRSLHEFKACKAAKLVDWWIWVERPGIPLDPTCQIRKQNCDYAICNDGTLDHLRLEVLGLLQTLNSIRSENSEVKDGRLPISA